MPNLAFMPESESPGTAFATLTDVTSAAYEPVHDQVATNVCRAAAFSTILAQSVDPPPEVTGTVERLGT